MTPPESPRRLRRRRRLVQLLAEAGGAAQVERDTGTPRSYLSALVNASRGVGDQLAAKLEAHYRKPAGWFDLPLDTAERLASSEDAQAARSAPRQLRTAPDDPHAGPQSALRIEEPRRAAAYTRSAPPSSDELKRTLWRLAQQLAALPEAPRKSVLYFIGQIGQAPDQPHDWIEQAGAIVQALPAILTTAPSPETPSAEGRRGRAATRRKSNDSAA